MKKILGIVLTLALLMSIISVIPVFAEKGYDGLYFYDFEDYETTEYGVFPDDNWMKVLSYGTKFKSTEDTYDRAMILQDTSDVSFKFPNVLKSGKLKVSFDAKTTTEKLRMLVMFYSGANINVDNYGKTLFINKAGDRYLSHYSTCSGWAEIRDKEIDVTDWHHYEFITSELSSNNAQMSCYVDGELLYSGLNLAAVNGIQTWTFRVQPAVGASALGANDGFIIDNLYIDTNPSDDKCFSRTDNSRFSADNGRISFISSEKIKGGLKNDNVTITNALTGQAVTDFNIDRADSQAFDIVFNGSVDNGRYNITFKDAIGEVSGKTLSGSFLVETEYKTTIIDGKTVYYPEVDNIKLYDGLENEISAGGGNPAMVSEVRAEFNTLISHNLDGLITITEDGTEIPVSYEVLDNTETERSTVVIRFDNSLKPFRNYKVTVNRGIPSVYSSDVTSFLEYTTEVESGNEKSLKCRDFGYDPTNKTARVVFTKDNDSSGSYIYVAAGYKTVTRQTKDGAKQVRLLTEVKYLPINLTSRDKGKSEYTLTLDGESGAEEYHTFLWKYPKLEKLMYDENGVILN